MRHRRFRFLAALLFLATAISVGAYAYPGTAVNSVDAKIHGCGGCGSPVATQPGVTPIATEPATEAPTEPPTVPPTYTATTPPTVPATVAATATATMPSAQPVTASGNCGNAHYVSDTPTSVYSHVVYNYEGESHDVKSANPITVGPAGANVVVLKLYSYTSLDIYATDANDNVVSNVYHVSGCNVVVTPTPGATATQPPTVPPTVSPTTPPTVAPTEMPTQAPTEAPTGTPVPALEVLSISGNCTCNGQLTVANQQYWSGAVLTVLVQYTDDGSIDSDAKTTVTIDGVHANYNFHVDVSKIDLNREFRLRVYGFKATSTPIVCGETPTVSPTQTPTVPLTVTPTTVPTTPATSPSTVTPSTMPVVTTTVSPQATATPTKSVKTVQASKATAPATPTSTPVKLPTTGAGPQHGNSTPIWPIAGLLALSGALLSGGISLMRRRAS